MLKFAPKSNKQFQLSAKKEKKIWIYRLMLALPGTLKTRGISPAVWKYLLTFHIYYKPFSSFSNNRNVCAITGRTRSVYRTFQLSRVEARKRIGAGMFFGIAKSSW